MPKKATLGQHKNWQENVRFWFEGIGLIVLIAYTTFAALQWHQMKRATDLAQKANADAWTLANRANQTAIESERPWVGISFAIQDWEVGKFPSATVFFINNGRRPAKVTLVQFDKRDYEVFPETPSYSRNNTDVKSVALILPNGTLTNTQPIGQLTQARLNELALRQQTFFIYARIDYDDVLTRAKHWTHGCWQYLPAFRNMSSGFVNCTSYNETDQ